MHSLTSFLLILISSILLSASSLAQNLVLNDWTVIVNSEKTFKKITLNQRDFFKELDQNKASTLTWDLDFQMENPKDDRLLVLPPSWLVFKTSINGHDVTPAHLRRAVKGSIYATNDILISKDFLKPGLNKIEIAMTGPPPLLGFRGPQSAQLLPADHFSADHFLFNFFSNYIHSYVYIFVSLALGVLALLLLRIYSDKREEHFYFALGTLLFQPYNLLTSEFYSNFFTSSELPFKFQIYFQAISWTFWAYCLLSQTDNTRIRKVLYNRFFYMPLAFFYVIIGLISPWLSFHQLALAVTPPMLAPVIVSPYWLYKQKNHQRFSFVLAFMAVAFSQATFFNHLSGGDQYLSGHAIFFLGVLAFKDLVKNFNLSIRRDQSAGSLLKNLLPGPMFGKVTHLLSEGATFKAIRQELQGDAIVTTIFVDICSFGEMSRKLSSKTLAAVRVEVFEHLKNIAELNRHYFIKCVGDNIHFSSGFLGEGQMRQSDLALSCLKTVRDILDGIDAMNLKLKDLDLPSVKIKVSATIGHAEFGLEGTKEQVRYDVLGHWINATKRLEDAMNSDFYQKYGYNCALVSTNLFNQCEDVKLRQRFFAPFEVTDKHGLSYSAYIAQQYENQLGKEELLSAVYGQFAHKNETSNSKRKVS